MKKPPSTNQNDPSNNQRKHFNLSNSQHLVRMKRYMNKRQATVSVHPPGQDNEEDCDDNEEMTIHCTSNGGGHHQLSPSMSIEQTIQSLVKNSDTFAILCDINCHRWIVRVVNGCTPWPVLYMPTTRHYSFGSVHDVSHYVQRHRPNSCLLRTLNGLTCFEMCWNNAQCCPLEADVNPGTTTPQTNRNKQFPSRAAAASSHVNLDTSTTLNPIVRVTPTSTSPTIPETKIRIDPENEDNLHSLPSGHRLSSSTVGDKVGEEGSSYCHSPFSSDQTTTPSPVPTTNNPTDHHSPSQDNHGLHHHAQAEADTLSALLSTEEDSLFKSALFLITTGFYVLITLRYVIHLGEYS